MDNPERHLREALDEIKALLAYDALSGAPSLTEFKVTLAHVQKSVETALRMLEGQ